MQAAWLASCEAACVKKRHAPVVVGSVRRAFRSLCAAACCGGIGASPFVAVLPISAATPIALSCPEPPAGLGHVSGNIRTAVIDDCLTVQGQEMTAHSIDSRMSVGVQVNGFGPFRFLVDSGADRSVIGVALAKRLNLPAGENVRLMSRARRISVPSWSTTSRSAIVRPSLSRRRLCRSNFSARRGSLGWTRWPTAAS